MSNKKELIVKAFSEMDLDMLELLFNDGKAYHNADKPTVLKKLGELFETFRKTGDTLLIPHCGKCTADNCPNIGKNGYAFTGNVSGNHVDFVLDELDDDWDDFCYCGYFKTDKYVPLNSPVEFNIYLDEEETFKPSVNYLILAQQCERAIAELSDRECPWLEKAEYSYWLEKHYELHTEVHVFAIALNQFRLFDDIYNELKKVARYLNFNESCEMAVNEYLVLNKDDEKKLLNWLTNYESLENQVGRFITFYLGTKNNGVLYFPLSARLSTINILTADYKNIITFKRYFDLHYWDLLEKYDTVRQEDKYKHPYYSNDNTSLQYHLKKRGMI